MLSLENLTGGEGLLVLVFAHTLARTAIVVVMIKVPGARAEGLASVARSTVSQGQVLRTTVLVAVVSLVFGAPVLALLGLSLASALLAWLSQRVFGGVTGDLLGAIEQVGEAVVMVLAASAFS